MAGPNSILKNLSDSLKTSVNRANQKMSEWVCENFKHPKNPFKNWSFEGHEYQIDILDCDKVEVATIKPAQTGVSELQIRFVLAFCAMHDYMKAAYYLPTAAFATEFSSTRVDPAIRSSQFVSDVVAADLDNTGAKQIGSCFLLMRGTSGTQSSISVDLDLLIADELNFCNLDILSAADSRLIHSDLKWKREFSTPTLPDYGIDEIYGESTKGERMVKCDSCHNWVAPSFFNDVIIPGFDAPMDQFRRAHLQLPGVQSAYLSCPSCHNELTLPNLNDPTKRQWVHSHPDREKAGFKVNYWDVPLVNTTPSVLRAIKNYKSYGDWINFRVGSSHSDAENSFIAASIDKATVNDLENLEYPSVTRVYIGSDLGKISHLVIGVASASGLNIIYVGRVVVQDLPEQSYGKFLCALFKKMRGVKIIIDAAPSYEPSLYLYNNLPRSLAYGAYYIAPSKSSLDIYEFKDDKGVVHMDRSASMSDTCAAVNGGLITFPDCAEMKEVRKHLLSMKKVRRLNSRGNEEEIWVAGKDPDHYAHALNYCYASYASLEHRYVERRVGVLPEPRRVRMGDGG